METGTVRIERGNEYYSMHNNQGLSWYTVYCELMDNSKDNNATVIEWVTTEKDCIIIKDNGLGIKDNPSDIGRILRMYYSESNGNPQKIGQYGIGLKDAGMKIGERMVIRSRSEGCNTIEIDVCWKNIDYEKGAKYTVLEDVIHDIGTTITFYFDEEDIKTQEVPPKPGKRSFVYYDRMIINNKLKIFLDGTEYQPERELKFKTEVKNYFNQQYHGKRFDVSIGILSKERDNLTNSGFWVYSEETDRYYNVHEVRVGSGTIEARDGLYILVGLRGTKTDWKVDRNKRGINNIDLVCKFLNEGYNSIYTYWESKLYNENKNNRIEELKDILAPFFENSKKSSLFG